MVGDSRVTYRRRHSYNTASNSVSVVKTPGGRLTVHYNEKSVNPAKCSCCKRTLPGLSRLRSSEARHVPSSTRSITRAYGGNLCHSCLHDRILRAFLAEEQKIVKSVAAAKVAAKKSDKKSTKKTGKK